MAVDTLFDALTWVLKNVRENQTIGRYIPSALNRKQLCFFLITCEYENLACGKLFMPRLQFVEIL